MARIPPHDGDAEAAVLGACLLHPGALERVAAVLDPEDFYDERHAAVYRAIIEVYGVPAPVDVVSVAARLESTGKLSLAGDRRSLQQLQAAAPLTGYADHHARTVARYARCRRAIAYAARLADAAYTGDADTLTETLAGAHTLDERGAPVEAPTEASELVATERPTDWIVAHLLARLEVVLLVAEPGAGKTTWLRQFAARVASGLHPFLDAQHIIPARVLSFDFQDPPGPAIRATRAMLECAGDRYGKTWWVELHQQGIDLTGPRDQAWFEAKVRSVAPDIVIAGPLYNMVRGAGNRSKQSEETAEMAGRFLLDLLARHNCALLLEAHAPHGDEMRVRGSKYWEDWAAFGFGLVDDSESMVDDKRALRVTRFRGDREVGRQWPSAYVEGRGRWPWQALHIPEAPPDEPGGIF